MSSSFSKALLACVALCSTGAYIEIQDEGTSLYRHTTVNFTGDIACSGDAAAGKTTCNVTAGGGSGDALEVEDGDNAGTFSAITTTGQLEDSGDINWVRAGAGAPHQISGEIRAGAVGTTEAAALDAGDTTTGTFADDRISGANETDEVVGTETDEAGCSWEATGSVIECDGSFTTPAANDNDTSPATTAFVQSEIDDGDFLTDNCALENDGTPIPDSCVGDGTDAGGTSTGTLVYHVEGFTNCCGTTEYLGVGSNTANCNATVGNVDIAHTGPTLTVGNLKCRQKTDTTCAITFTIMKNGAASAASTCTSTNAASCAASTTTDTIANGDTWALRANDDSANCTTGCELSCTFTAVF